MPYLMIKVLTNDIVSFEQLGPDTVEYTDDFDQTVDTQVYHSLRCSHMP